MRERIIQIMEREGMNPSKFAEAIGIQRSAMSHIISGRNNPSLDVLMKILEQFTYIDSDWLLFGRGEIIRNDNNQTKEPDLFSNLPVNAANPTVAPEYRRENRDNLLQNDIKHAVKESIIIPDKPSKIVTKIMVFYSDNTYDTFIPEKNK